MRSLKLIILCLLVAATGHAQYVQQMGYKDYSFPWQVNMGAGVFKTTNPAAYLELGTDNSTKGVLLPRAHRSNIVDPPIGLFIYEIDWKKITWWNGTSWDSSGSVGTGSTGTTYSFGAPFSVDVNNHVTLNGWNKAGWDSAFNKATFDTATRFLMLTGINGYYKNIYIPKGTSNSLDTRITSADIAYWNSKLNTGDTAAMLQGYATDADITTVNKRIDSVKLIADTANHLEYTNGIEKTGNKVYGLTDNALWNARKLQGYWIDPVEPLDGQAPIFHADTKSYIPGFFDGSGVNGGGADGNYYLDNVTLNNGHMIFSRVTLSPLDVALFDSLDKRYITLPQLNDSLDAILPIVMDGKFFKGEGTDVIPVTLRDDLFPPAPIEFTAGAATSSVQLLGASNYLVEVIRGALSQSAIDKGDGFYYTKIVGSETLTFYPALKAGEFVHLSFTNPNLSSPINKQ